MYRLIPTFIEYIENILLFHLHCMLISNIQYSIGIRDHGGLQVFTKTDSQYHTDSSVMFEVSETFLDCVLDACQ